MKGMPSELVGPEAEPGRVADDDLLAARDDVGEPAHDRQRGERRDQRVDAEVADDGAVDEADERRRATIAAANATGMATSASSRKAASMPAAAMVEPTDRSNPPPMMTMVSPTATMPDDGDRLARC